MSSSGSSMSPSPKDLLRRAKAEGSLEAFVTELLSDHSDEFELIPGEENAGLSMTDASKRRMVTPPEKPEKEVVMSGGEKSVAGDFPASYGTRLPPGIRDMAHWGKTVLASGKYEKSKFSYAEITSSIRQEHTSYCAWMLSQKCRVDLTPPIKDFVRYLNAKSLIDQTGDCFEGSTVRRVTKE